jgi:hypothetical protein
MEENLPGYHILRYGRPLWASIWLTSSQSQPWQRFKDIIELAKYKLIGRVRWTDIHPNMMRTSAIAIIACTSDLYVSPSSNEASDLVKSHMATLVGMDYQSKRHIITYPSEPVLSEAAMELLSEEGSEVRILKELEGIWKQGGIISPGNQGELVVKLLLLRTWRRLVCSTRGTDITVSRSFLLIQFSQPALKYLSTHAQVPFSTRLPVLDFLSALIKEFPRGKCSQLEGFRVGFTHFVTLYHTPDKETLENMFKRNAAVSLRLNAVGGDLLIPVKKGNDLGALVIQVRLESISC